MDSGGDTFVTPNFTFLEIFYDGPMPTYDYRCETCGVDFEFQQSFSDDTLKKCPGKRSGGPVATACSSPGKGKVVKVFSKVGISFKGDGFYKNDHGAGAASKAKATDESAGTGDSAATSSSSDTSGDSKKSDTTSDSKKSDSKKSDTKTSGDAKKGTKASS